MTTIDLAQAASYEQFLMMQKGERGYLTSISIASGTRDAKISNSALKPGAGLSLALRDNTVRQITTIPRYPLVKELENKLSARKQGIQKRRKLVKATKYDWIVWESEKQAYLEDYFELECEAKDYCQQLIDGRKDAKAEFENVVRTTLIGAYFDELNRRLGDDSTQILVKKAAQDLGVAEDLTVELINRVIADRGMMPFIEEQVEFYSRSFPDEEEIRETFHVGLRSPKPIPAPELAETELERKAIEAELRDLRFQSKQALDNKVRKLQEDAERFLAKDKHSPKDIESRLRKYQELKREAMAVHQALDIQVFQIEETLEKLQDDVAALLGISRRKPESITEAEADDLELIEGVEIEMAEDLDKFLPTAEELAGFAIEF